MERHLGVLVSIVAGLLFCLTGSLTSEAAQFIAPAGYSVTYPETWSAHVHVDGRDVALSNYPPQELPPGRMEPPGGAMIVIQTFPPYDNPYFPQGSDDYNVLDAFVRNDTVIARTTRASGQPARVTSVTTALNTRFVHTILHKGGKTFFIMFDCNADDSQIAAYEQVLNDVIVSISVAAPSPAPTTPTP